MGKREAMRTPHPAAQQPASPELQPAGQGLEANGFAGIGMMARLAMVLILFAAYAAGFPHLYVALHDNGVALSAIPVLAVGAYFGLRLGIASGVLVLPLNVVLLSLEGHVGPAAWLEVGLLPSSLMVVCVGAIVGWLRQSVIRAREERDGRATEEEYAHVSSLNQMLLRSMGEGIYAVDLEGRTTFANPAAERLLGWTAGQLLGQHHLDTLCWDGLETSPVELVLQRSQSRSGRGVWLGRQDGTRFPVQYLCTPVRHQTGTVTGAVVCFTDDSDQARAEEALKESEANFRATFDGAAVGMVRADMTGRVVETNPAMQRMLGYTAEELATLSFEEITHPEERGASQRALRKLMQGVDDHAQMETRYIRKDGEVRWARVTLSLVRGADGAPRFPSAMVEDITEQREVKAAEQMRRQELEALFNIGSVLVQPNAFEERATSVLCELSQVAEAYRVTLWTPDQREHVLLPTAAVKENQPVASGRRSIEFGAGVAGRSYISRQPIIENHYADIQGSDSALVNEGTRSLASIPIVVGDEVLGIVSVAALQPNHFTPERVRLLTAIVDSMGPLMQNTLLVAAERLKSDELEALFNIASTLVRPDGFEEKATAVLEEVVAAFQGDHVALGMPEPEGAAIRFVAMAGPAAPDPASTPPIPIEGTISGSAYLQGVTVVVNEYPGKFDSSNIIGSRMPQPIGSMAAFPIKAGGHTLGIIHALSFEKNFFTPERVKFLTAVGENIGSLLENARLYQEITSELDRGNRRLEAFRAAAARLTLEEQPEQALEHLVEVARSLVGARQGAMAIWEHNGELVNFIASGGPKQPANEDFSQLRTSMDGLHEQASLLHLDDQVAGQERPPWTWYGAEGLLGIPFICKDGRLGVFALLDRDGEYHRFSAADGRLLSLFSVLAGVMIDNVRLFSAEARERSTLGAIQASMTEGLVVLDSQGRVTYFNEAAESLTGPPAEHSIGQDFQEQLRQRAEFFEEPESIDALIQTIERVGENPAPVVVALHGRHRRELSITVFPIPAPRGGQMTGVLIHDVTEELDLQRRRDTFVSVASHELRTPMTTIMGFSELLLKRDVPHDLQRRWLSLIHDDSERITAIVDDMLNVSRIQSGRMPVTRSAMGVQGVLEEVTTRMLHPAQESHNIVLDVSLGIPKVVADRDKLSQVLVNLLENAAKYSPVGGRITVGAVYDPKRERVVLSVGDQGIGISREDMEGLFSTFYRIRRPETEKVRGTGLGLYIVKALVEMMDGEVWVRSKLNKGTTFYFALPTEVASQAVTSSVALSWQKGTGDEHARDQ